ncbi:hypothetical protein ILUMI_04722 [Ignelater luminosus]|uniref:Uncharacterized protein n=1 Tax=Ignelater luminosus TaxID=2038154 RepID=A0A8K0DE90_IGNLU|nr:hypothetical protein ILUMI_04722 [Ignelater luminosus]
MSMDPDSLEFEHLSTPTADDKDSDYSTPEKDYSVGSYASHDYLSDDKVIYAHPKAIILNPKTNENKDNIYSNINIDNKGKDIINDIEVNIHTIEINRNNMPIITKSEETFIDSLEPLAEISTAF